MVLVVPVMATGMVSRNSTFCNSLGVQQIVTILGSAVISDGL
jgi:hypothetical protein